MRHLETADFCPFEDASTRPARRIARSVTDRRRLVTRLVPGAVLGLAARRRGRVAAQAGQWEARALWVNRFEYDSAADIRRVMERAAGSNFNIVYFQVRGAGDAFYPSKIEPCAVGLCGRLGGEPPYDALAVAIEEGHSRGLEVHAWLNALSGWSSGSEESCARLTQPEGEEPRHMLLDHPEFAVMDANGDPLACPNEVEYVYLSPGYEQVRRQLGRVTRDVAKRYDVQGIHLDRIRLPGRDWSYDPASLEAFGRDPEAEPEAWDDFRRSLVNETVRAAYEAMQAVDPELVLSASVWELYRDRWDWGATGGYEGYFQDPRAWVKGGYLDVAVPMTYDPIDAERCQRADWDCLVDDHVAAIQDEFERHVYAGIAAWHGEDEIRRAVEIGRGYGVAGFSVYSYSQVEKYGLWEMLAEGPFREPARIPPRPWKTPPPRVFGDGTGGPELDG